MKTQPSVFTDHFTNIASNYAAWRPNYPAELFAWLAVKCQSCKTAWDCATGNGQAALALAEYFEQVFATDASVAQIAEAVAHPAVLYQVAPADASGLPETSVDLITVAQALHWFNLDSFYHEVHRVLKPGGLLAVWSYGIFKVDCADADKVQSMLDRFYHHTIKEFWPAERRHVENGYADLPFPFLQLNTPEFNMEVAWSLDDLAGYLRSWSAVSRYHAQCGFDPVEPLVSELYPLWGKDKRRVSWPLTLKVGRQMEQGK